MKSYVKSLTKSRVTHSMSLVMNLDTSEDSDIHLSFAPKADEDFNDGGFGQRADVAQGVLLLQ